MNIEIGVYKHYKGNEYYVMGLAQDGELMEDRHFVVYMALYPKSGPRMFIRAKETFFELVTLQDGRKVPRYEKVADAP